MTEAQPSISLADLSVLRAIRAWGGGDLAAGVSRLSPAWRKRLRNSWDRVEAETRDEAKSTLVRDHEASARPDPSRIHPSWFVRALQSESPAVRLAIVAHAPGPIAEPLRRGLGIDRSEAAADREPDPDVIGCAFALWSERLAGDVPGLDSDPLVVMAITRLGPRDLARLVKTCGVVKLAFATAGNGRDALEGPLGRSSPLDRVRFAYFRRQIGVADPRIVPMAQHDLGAAAGDPRRGLSRIGLVTLARLLATVEPHRARWASQHLPYPVAKAMRIKELPPISPKSLIAWESWVLEAAWTRLWNEGRIAGARASIVEPAIAGVRP